MKLRTSILLLTAVILAASCAENSSDESATVLPGDTVGSAQSQILAPAQAIAAIEPQNSALFGIVDMVVATSGLTSTQGTDVPAGVLSDQANQSDVNGIWDITGPWDSVDDDVAYLVISMNENTNVGTSTLYDYDGDDAGSGMDCFVGPFVANARFEEEYSVNAIDGPYPLNGIVSINGDGSGITLYMLDLLDVDQDADHDEIIEYRAKRASITQADLTNICE